MSSLYRRLHGLFNTIPRPKTIKPTSIITKTATATATATATSTEVESSPPDPPLSPKDRKLELIVKKFKKSSNSDRFRLRHSHYAATVFSLAKDKNFSHIEDILEHQKKYKDITNERFTVRIISLYGKVGMFDHAHKVFEEMPQLNCERTVLSFNALLEACIKSKRFDKISEFFRELPQKLSIEPNRVSYNIVIKSFCELGSLDAAALVVDDMEKNGIEPDLITYNTLLNAFYKNTRFSDAEKFWVVMESKNLVPNVRSYNAKLRALVADNRLSEAVELIEEMGRKEVKPDVYSFNSLIKGFCDEGNMEEAKKWYAEIAKNEHVPQRMTFEMLMPFACDKGESDFALELCKTAIKQRCFVDKEIMQQVVDGLVKELKIEAAEELVDLCNSTNYFHYELKLPIDE